MIRDRFEVIMYALVSGEEIQSPRTRFEMIINAIVNAIGGGGGSSADTLYTNAENTSVINNSYSLTIENVTYTDYKYLVIYVTDQANAQAATAVMTIEGITDGVPQYFVGTNGGNFQLKLDIENNALKGTNNYNGQNCIKKIIGVK